MLTEPDYTWPWEGFDTVPVDKELNTLLRLEPSFPLAVVHDDLSAYKDNFVNWHKQTSIEISRVTKGAVVVNLLQHQEIVREGEIFIILPDTLHSIRCNTFNSPAIYETIMFEPYLLTQTSQL